jgi:allophanate hydrolase subunit 2
LAVNGGFDVPVVMGSRSCYVGARIGGYNGRALAADDILSRMNGATPEACFQIPEVHIPEFPSQAVLRVIAGPQDDFFDAGIQAILGRDYRVSPEAGRSGYRLEGPKVDIAEGRPGSIISEPSLAGSVQIPENGQPIILLNEQTVGGYAKIATVIQPDIDTLAQLIPGDRLRFEQIDLDTAHRVVAAYASRMESVGNSLEKTSDTGRGCLSVSTIQNWADDPEAFAQRVNQYLVQM